MRCLMGEAHRRLILSCCRPGDRVLEWGMGGTTAWLAEHMPPGVHFTSVEHDADWFAQVSTLLADRAGCELLLRPPTCPPGRNATCDEESTDGLDGYLAAGDGRTFDVIIVDGVARNSCLENATRLLAPGGKVFLHDAQRPWYDRGKALLVEYGVVGTCPDYPPAWLWVGTTIPTEPAPTGPPVLVVSFFTVGTSYEAEAAVLEADCAALGLECLIEPVSPVGSWARNTNLKAEFCRLVWKRTGRPVLWVDADARIRRPPSLSAWQDADLAVHKWDGWQMATGTMYFAQSEGAKAYLEAWCEWCRRLPDLPDQIPADLAWEQVSSSVPLRTVWMPRSHYQIFDADRQGSEPVVEHFQASRRLKAEVSDGVATPYPAASAHVRTCRAASRPRRWMLTHTDSAEFLAELAAETEQELGCTGLEPSDQAKWLGGMLDAVLAPEQRVGMWLLEATARDVAARGQRFAIYGTGHVGRQLAAVCRAEGAPPTAYVESAAGPPGTCDGLPILSPEGALAAGIRLFLLGSIGSQQAMRGRLEWTCRQRGVVAIVEPRRDIAPPAAGISPRALVQSALESGARGRSLDEHAWLFGRPGHVIDAGLSVTPAVDRLRHLDRYRFVGIHAGGRRVLDLAAGSGDGCYWMWRHGYAATVAGLEQDATCHAYATRHYASPFVSFPGSMESLMMMCAPHTWDVVLHFAPAEDVCGATFVTAVKRLLSPEGRFVTAVPPQSDTVATLQSFFPCVTILGQWAPTNHRPGLIAPLPDGPAAAPDDWLIFCSPAAQSDPVGSMRTSGSSGCGRWP